MEWITVGAAALDTLITFKEFVTVFRPNCSYYVEKKFVPVSNVGPRSPLTDWQARFNVDLDIEVLFVAIR